MLPSDDYVLHLLFIGSRLPVKWCQKRTDRKQYSKQNFRDQRHELYQACHFLVVSGPLFTRIQALAFFTWGKSASALFQVVRKVW